MRKGTSFASFVGAVLLGVAAFAAGEAELEKARSLLKEAEPFAARGDDPDLADAERKEGRKEARRLLRAARDAYQAWQLQNEDRDDPVGSEIAKLLYWVNKMSSIAEVSPGGGPPAPAPRAPEAPRPAPAAPGPAPGPASPPAAPDPAQQARDDLAKLEAWAKDHPEEVGALKEAYEKFLADHPDPSLPEFTRAAERLGTLQEELNATFKAVVRQDPDAVEGVDTKATPAVMARLKRELQTRDAETRRRAAKLLGMTRSGAASFVLVGVLRDDDAELARIAGESLAAIGGGRTCENLTKQHRNGSRDGQLAAVAVLEQIARKGPVDARTASPWIGRFACSPDEAVTERAFSVLTSLGADGGPGLVEALESRVAAKRLAAIDALGSSGYVKGTRRLCAFLLRGDGEIETYRARSQKAILSFGVPAVPYLIDALGDGRQKAWVGYTLRQLTGAQIGDDNPRAWREWYEVNKNAKR